MPLVVPGLMGPASHNNASSQQEEWMSKLMGKRITDGAASDATNFAKQDLPKEHRIVESGGMATTDYNPNRMNVHLAEDGTVSNVDFK
ncbi:hypothetical protein MMC21_001605 [Puttea exsequens]|nr:hypothetical protein [Puttea exsequens]